MEQEGRSIYFTIYLSRYLISFMILCSRAWWLNHALGIGYCLKIGGVSGISGLPMGEKTPSSLPPAASSPGEPKLLLPLTATDYDYRRT